MTNVEIYTRAFCPYCSRAKTLLDSKKVVYQEHAVDGGGPLRQEMIQRAGGHTTVPQVFIDGRHVGGSDELYDLERRGMLDKMLAA